MFYDAVEDVEGLSSDDEKPSMLFTDPRLRKLEQKLSSIPGNRARLKVGGSIPGRSTISSVPIGDGH